MKTLKELMTGLACNFEVNVDEDFWNIIDKTTDISNKEVTLIPKLT